MPKQHKRERRVSRISASVSIVVYVWFRSELSSNVIYIQKRYCLRLCLQEQHTFQGSKTGIVKHLVLTRYMLRRYSSTPSVKFLNSDLYRRPHSLNPSAFFFRNPRHGPYEFNVVLPIYGFRLTTFWSVG